MNFTFICKSILLLTALYSLFWDECSQKRTGSEASAEPLIKIHRASTSLLYVILSEMSPESQSLPFQPLREDRGSILPGRAGFVGV